MQVSWFMQTVPAARVLKNSVPPFGLSTNVRKMSLF